MSLKLIKEHIDTHRHLTRDSVAPNSKEGYQRFHVQIKAVCALLMEVVNLLFGLNDHREAAPHFNSINKFW